MTEIKTVQMERGEEKADVHPDEVENMKLHDWREVETADKPEKKATRKAK